MDSEGVRQAAAAMNGSDVVKNKLDLELRLGLPDNDENPPKNQGQQFDPTLLAANDHVDWSHLALHPREDKDKHVPHGGVHVDASGGPLQLEMHDYYANSIKHCASPTGIDHPPNHPPIFPGMIVNNQFVDISHINNMESGMSSSSNGPQKLPIGRRRQGHNDTDNPNKRCANPLCNATSSPMWRRGPLGPKV
ncbi:uncharacterized protein LOC115734149 [Rhodamnia argentea]|uniref:Uncharacterized protein LOC115734149 n=1 Tax=Rhodamnia argentea TaxID=178133 RepID=A0A8B8NDS2_9MYRT|nr:uncharacterized protein LOC115734149 [Rhodamnia argentea]